MKVRTGLAPAVESARFAGPPIASPLSRTGKKGVGFAANVALLYFGCAIGGKAVSKKKAHARDIATWPVEAVD